MIFLNYQNIGLESINIDMKNFRRKRIKGKLGESLWEVQYVLLFLKVLVSSGGAESIRLRVRRLFNDSSFN